MDSPLGGEKKEFGEVGNPKEKNINPRRKKQRMGHKFNKRLVMKFGGRKGKRSKDRNGAHCTIGSTLLV